MTVPAKKLHINNVHREGYDFLALAHTHPPLSAYLIRTVAGHVSIDYADPHAVMALNTALLSLHYGIDHWGIPAGFLCPPIPGRADYIHYIAELLNLQPGHNEAFRVLDVGTGANGIYALLASKMYGAQCVASDIDPEALKNLEAILARNPSLQKTITLRLQTQKHHIFEGVILPGEYYAITVCNPPFHASLEEANKSSQKKLQALAANRHTSVTPTTARLNFGGQKAELWCKGGERKFIRMMIKESARFAAQCGWFTTLVSKAENIAPAKKLLRKQQAAHIQEIPMVQGHKVTRILAWRY